MEGYRQIIYHGMYNISITCTIINIIIKTYTYIAVTFIKSIYWFHSIIILKVYSEGINKYK